MVCSTSSDLPVDDNNITTLKSARVDSKQSKSLLLTIPTLQPRILHKKMVNKVYSTSLKLTLEGNNIATQNEKMVKQC